MIGVLEPYTNGEEIKYIEEAILNNEISYHGNNITEFRTNLEKKCDLKDRILLVNSGTSAIHLALILAGVSSGDEVICQSFTFCASVNPIKYLGATPIFVDSELSTWNICPNHLKTAIKDRISKGKKPKAIIFTNNYGMPANIDAIQTIARQFDIKLIEDSASALGSEYKSVSCGNFGDYAIFSFNSNKIITTSGGGALICPNTEKMKLADKLANQSKENTEYYLHKSVGYNYRLSNINAGIGRAQLKSLNNIIEKKRAINKRYSDQLNHIKGVSIKIEPSKDYYSNFWLSNLLLDSSLVNFDIQDLKKNFKRNLIKTRPLWKPMHLQPAYNKTLYFGEDNCENLFLNGLSLPSSYNLTLTEQNKVIKTILNLT